MLDRFVEIFLEHIFVLLCWSEAKVNTPPSPMIPTPSPTCSLERLSNVMMKHNLAPGVKDKPSGLCRPTSVSCRLSMVMNISYGPVGKPL